MKISTAPRWAKNVTAEEWLRRIEDLPEDMQGPIAVIVWFDCLSKEPASEPISVLDGLRTTADGVSDSDLIAGLLAVGYDIDRARGRVFRRQGPRRHP